MTITLKISKLFYIGRNIYRDTQNTISQQTQYHKRFESVTRGSF